MESKNKLSPAHLKWIVIGVLGIAFMVIFKDELADMLKDASKVTVGPDGVSITRTVSTPLGKTILSGPPTIETARVTAESPPNYRSPTGYLINWPQNGAWSLHPELAASLGVEIMIGYNNSWGNFVPNVNVTIESSGGIPIRQWMDWSRPKIQQIGFSIVNENIDDKSNSAVRVVHGNFMGINASATQRILLGGGRAYIATAIRPDNLNADPQLWRDLNYIINSFRLN